MPFKLPEPVDMKAAVRRTLRPRTKLGRTTLWFGGLALLLEALRLVIRSSPESLLSGWARFILIVFVVCASLMALRYVRRVLLWRLRTRLIVTYVFIGVIPIVLLMTMFFLAAYLFAGQFATYVATTELQSQAQHLEAANNSLARQFLRLLRSGNLNQDLATEAAAASEEGFHHRRVTVWEGDKSFVLEGGRAVNAVPIKPPPGLKGNFAGFVLDADRFHIRVVKQLEEGPHKLVVVSDVPITAEVLRPATSQLGAVTLLPADKEEVGFSAVPPPPANSAPSAKAEAKPATGKAGENKLQVDLGDTKWTVNLAGQQRVEAGRLPEPTNRFDIRIPFATRFPIIDWETGKPMSAGLAVDTRPSMLYSALFSALGDKAGIFVQGLMAIAVFFGLIELVALFIGVRLTRSMTKSVAELYSATQHVNRGDLRHRIQVRTRDQMAALEESFNSMMGSLSGLIAEQKEKQRLEGELAIAHEVQTLLFPADLSGLASLEVHGVCNPARTVSGDYYDFIPLREDKLVLAVGDISGKGISAALLMATVHAFVRAYSLEPEQAVALVAQGNGVAENHRASSYTGGNGAAPEVTPAQLMATLNYQLFRATPPEKYATMFLGSYDAAARALTYCNAGHLPPLLLGGDGRITRLQTSGTVVGLFDGICYDESTIMMHPGDIFVAYSDGITEPENEFGEFGEERLIELIQRHRGQSLARISSAVTGAVSDWIAGAEQPDDVTLVLARAR